MECKGKGAGGSGPGTGDGAHTRGGKAQHARACQTCGHAVGAYHHGRGVQHRHGVHRYRHGGQPRRPGVGRNRPGRKLHVAHRRHLHGPLRWFHRTDCPVHWRRPQCRGAQRAASVTRGAGRVQRRSGRSWRRLERASPLLARRRARRGGRCGQLLPHFLTGPASCPSHAPVRGSAAMCRRHAHTQRAQHAHVPPRRGVQLLPHLPHPTHGVVRHTDNDARHGLRRGGRSDRHGVG